jgi:hypothetical protein
MFTELIKPIKSSIMKTMKINLKTILFVCLCFIMLSAAKCDSDDPEPQNEEPCAELECQNGGTAYQDVELGGCRCNCPTGFTGEHCETMN